MGTMAQMALSDLRDKTKRGQLGRIRAGRIPCGLAYGYEVVPPPPGAKESGERRIIDAEADIVRRIFTEYAAGKSPRNIAAQLNKDKQLGPNGRPWGDTTIRGQSDRGTGVLNNALYIGRLAWNRCSYVKDPSTGRRVARVNPASQWEIVEVPELRIIDQDLWDTVRVRQDSLKFDITPAEAGSHALNGTHRRKFLLSGLLTCGCCNGGYTVIGKDRYGCATRRGKGTCTNDQSITRQRIEQRVLSGLKDRMLNPEIVAEFVNGLAEETVAARREALEFASRLDAERSDIERRLEGVLRAIENGAWSNALQVRLTELESRKASMAQAMEPPLAMSLPANAAEIYRDKVANLVNALAQPDICREAADILASLIDRVTLTPDAGAPDGLRVELQGDLAMILAAAGVTDAGSKHEAPASRGAEPGLDGSLLSVVAGTRIGRDRHSLTISI